MNTKGEATCRNQKQLFWHLVNNEIFNIEVLKSRGRYVILHFGVGKLYSTEIRRLDDMTLDDWVYEIVKVMSNPHEWCERYKYWQKNKTFKGCKIT